MMRAMNRLIVSTSTVSVSQTTGLPNRVGSSLRRISRSFLSALVLCVAALVLAGCDPTPEENLETVRTLQSEGRIDESIALLREMIDAGERSGEAMFRYGRALSLSGKPGRGMWALEEATLDSDWFVRACHQLAFDAYRAANQELTLEILERLKNGREDDHAEDLPARMLELRVRVETRRQYEEALLLAEEVLDDFPDEEEAIRLKAASLLGLKETDEAFELIKEAGILTEGIAAPNMEEGNTDASGDVDLAEGETETDAEKSYWCLVRSMFKREAGEFGEAEESITQCLEADPSNIALIDEAIKLHSLRKNYVRVDEILKAAHEASPDDMNLRLAWVKHLDNTGRDGEAEGVLRKSLERALAEPAPAQGPNVLVASRWVDLGGFLVDHGETNDGLDAYAEAFEILGELAAPELLFRHADGLIAAARYDEALAIADKTTIEIHSPMIRGRVAFEREDYPTAIEELTSASLRWPDNAPIRYYLARSYEGVGDLDAAVEEYRQAIRSDPGLSAARERLTRLHLAENRVRQANAILGFLSPIKESTPSSEMRILNVEVQARLGQEPELTVPTGTDMPLDELRRRTVASLAQGLSTALGPLNANDVLAELQNQVSDAPSKGYFVRARVRHLLEAGEIDSAVALARESSKDELATVDVGIALGRALTESGTETDEAKGLLEKALRFLPDDVETLTHLGRLAQLRGDTEAESLYFDRVAELDASYRPAFEYRLAALEAAGDKEAALRLLTAFVDRHNPYDGRAALDLAKALAPSEKDRRVALAERAIRFGAGRSAVDFLKTVDPSAAERYEPKGEQSASSPQAEAEAA